MKLEVLFAAGCLVLLSNAAAAQSAVDVRIASSTLEIDDGFDDIESDGIGLDVRGHFEINDNIFIRGEFTRTNADEAELNGVDFDADLKTTIARGGAGYQGGKGSVRFYGAAELGRVELNIEGEKAKDDGAILSAGIKDSGEGKFLWHAELGYVAFDDLDGASFDFALGYRVSPSFAILIGGQSYVLEDDAGGDTTLAVGTLGVRFVF